MHNKQKLLFIFLMFLIVIMHNSCLESILDSQGVAVYLYEKKPLSDTTIVVGDSLCLNLLDYFYLEDNYDRYSGHPSIEPGIEDTSIAEVNYHYSWSDNGKNYNILAKKVGSTELYLYLKWWTSDNTVTTTTTKTFLLNIVEGN